MVLISTFLITNGVDHFFIFFEHVCAISCEIATIPPLVYSFQRTTKSPGPYILNNSKENVRDYFKQTHNLIIKQPSEIGAIFYNIGV